LDIAHPSPTRSTKGAHAEWAPAWRRRRHGTMEVTWNTLDLLSRGGRPARSDGSVPSAGSGLGAVDDDDQDSRRRGTLAQIYALAAAGADIVRCTCNEEAAAEAWPRSCRARPCHRGRHPLPPRDGPRRPRGRRAGPAAQPRNLRKEHEIKQVRRGARPRRAHPHRVNAGSLHPDCSSASAGQRPRRSSSRPHGARLLRRGRLHRRQDLGQGSSVAS